ncbi:MAG TPA: tetratricopeptide repeat protein [Gemmatimonadaceae bacterium]|nr:tetratricopeptide repeat protein [Gemmatimonadaceae bacterium]
MNHILRGTSSRALSRLLFAGVCASSLVACDTDKLVKVEDPAQLSPQATATAAAVPALVNGAVRQFEAGYSGLGDDAFLSASGVITDEFAWGDSFTTRFAADRRTLQPPQLGNISDAAFSRLEQARMLALRALAAVDKFETDLDDPEGFRADLQSALGYSYVTLSEGWCSGVPFSNVPTEGDIDPTKIQYGSPQTTAQINDSAIVAFDAALAADPTNELAMVGKGRALLNLGLYDEAEAAVADVGTTFVYLIEHSTNTSAQNNGIASLMDNGRYTISNLEGGTSSTGTALRPDNNAATSDATAEGLNYRTAQDPRIPYELTGACFTRSIVCYRLNNYPDFNADVPLASGVEARLIEAEAAMQRGDGVTMMAKLNSLRSQVASLLPLLYPEQIQTFPPATDGAPSLAPLVDPVTPAARRDLLFRERAFWLYATGHRQGDLRRLVRNYGLPQTSVFPSGLYFRAAGSSFGTDVAYPVPFNEENNPNFDRAACNTTGA